jgi:uncharacterized protein YndB with AHSA1/START domain
MLSARKNMLKVTTPSDHEIVMTRSFNAPRELVWDAMTTPDLVKRWMFTPPGWTWSVCEMDVRVGGNYRWEWNGPDGRMGLAIWGVHREVQAPAKLVHSERMEMGPGAGECGGGEAAEPWELLATLELTERDGQTHLRMTLLFPNKEARDMALASGMEHGVSAGYDTLDSILSGSPGG